jgi:hypothetical protein
LSKHGLASANVAALWDLIQLRGYSTSRATDEHLNQPCFKRCGEDDISSSRHISSNLSVFEKRKETDPERWGVTGAIWIRTWYGNEALPDHTSVEETVTRASADEAYLRLCRKALWPPQVNYEFDGKMFGPNVFDNDDAAYGVATRDADVEVELMDNIPPFILNALIRCPDAMESGNGGRETIEDNDDLKWRQKLLIVVADREAREDAWVLLIALNHKGQVLHMRVRCKSYQVAEQVYFFRDGGDLLDVTEAEENVIHYLEGNKSGNGWDEDWAITRV